MRLVMIAKSRIRQRKPGLRGLGLWWTFTAALALVAAIIVAIVQNSRRVEVRYLGWRLNVSLIVLILATALIAVMLDEAGGLVWRRRRRSSLERQRELNQLRTPQDRSSEAPPLAEPGSPAAEATGAQPIRQFAPDI
jgi:uncharacterized integral membrane protein